MPLPKRPQSHKADAIYHPEYKIWYAMRQRCRYEKSKAFSHYGGRGIDYCEEWDWFWNFFKDMGPRPSSKHQIDRIDNNGNYCKENCRWVLRSSNQANKRRPSKSMGAYKGRWGGWKSAIGIEGRVYHIGSFKEKEDAQNEYKKVFHEWYGFYPNKEIKE